MLTRACAANIENPVDITHDGTRASACERGEEGGRMMKFRWTGKGDEEQEEELKKNQKTTTYNNDLLWRICWGINKKCFMAV